MNTTATTAKLVEAYHLVFDFKDTLEPGSPGFAAAYNAVMSIASLLDPSDRPRRFDGDGRADGDSVVVSHEDWAEVRAAIDIAAQVTRTVGDVVSSDHYDALAAKYA